MDFDTEVEKNFYEACQTPGGLTTHDFSERYPDATAADMARAVNVLSGKGYIEFFQGKEGVLLYKAIRKEDIAKSSDVRNEDSIVYNIIRASANEGIWTRHIKAKSNLHEAVIKRCLKNLEAKALVKAIKSVKHPTRKLYMLMELTPSVEVTGGPWFTDQELDVDFVEQLTYACYKFILGKSFPRDNSCIYTTAHNSYPTAAVIRKYIMDKRISQVDLTVDDITMLLDVLVYDGKVERFHGLIDENWGDDDDTDSDWVYKAVRDKKAESAWQDCPCGVCPVAELCTESGPINPAGCTYFSKWLDF
ncbi:34-kDa subunit of RNA polymerase III (C) [Podila epigama]|nr:34-kDa subunit of RNA polymerase III (C) [Podila epigama]